MPGHEKTVSVSTAPESSVPSCRPVIVTTGISAFLRTWRADDAALGQALGARRRHVVLADLLQHRRARHARDHGQRDRRERQRRAARGARSARRAAAHSPRTSGSKRRNRSGRRRRGRSRSRSSRRTGATRASRRRGAISIMPSQKTGIDVPPSATTWPSASPHPPGLSAERVPSHSARATTAMTSAAARARPWPAARRSEHGPRRLVGVEVAAEVEAHGAGEEVRRSARGTGRSSPRFRRQAASVSGVTCWPSSAGTGRRGTP